MARTTSAAASEKAHLLLCRDHGLQASYDTLWRYVRQELGWHKKAPTV